MNVMLRYLAVTVWTLAMSQSLIAGPVLLGVTRGVGGTPPTYSALVDVDVNTGLVTNPRSTGILNMAGIAVQPTTGIVFGLTSVFSPTGTLVSLDVATGTATVVGSTGLSNIVEGDLAFNPANGLLYGIQATGASGTEHGFFQVDSGTGVGTLIGDVNSPGSDFSAMAFDAAGTLYVVDTSGTNSRIFVLNSSNASVLNIINMNVNLGGGAGLAFDPATGQAYIADCSTGGTNLLYNLNTSTGALTAIGPTGYSGLDGIVGLTFVSVPEPTSLMLGVCLVAMLAAKKRVSYSGSEQASRSL